ncbi:hypothetical protein ACIBEJ_18670 [Nonomuraea sp. NPDC050790]|uniref:hypothetical protein n=1 Tax=Nonomuraea sp. NPDC050790 TaxID=3364371 RepID=UPI00379A1150
MTFTEDDLRALLDERTACAPEGATSVTQIVRRGRRMLMIRWGMGAVLAGAAALVVFLLVPWRGPDPVQVAAATPSAAPASAAPRDSRGMLAHEPPPALDGGARRTAGVSSTKSAVGHDLKLGPKSTRVVVRCEEAGAWVVVSFKGGKGRTGRCDGGEAEFEVNGKGKSVRVWVFPGRAPVVDKPLGSCAVAQEEKGLCDGRYAAAELIRYDVALSLAADLGVQPGAWSAAVYDRP